MVLLLITIILFGITEIAIRRLPGHEGLGKTGDAVTDAFNKRALFKRASGESASLFRCRRYHTSIARSCKVFAAVSRRINLLLFLSSSAPKQLIC